MLVTKNFLASVTAVLSVSLSVSMAQAGKPQATANSAPQQQSPQKQSAPIATRQHVITQQNYPFAAYPHRIIPGAVYPTTVQPTVVYLRYVAPMQARVVPTQRPDAVKYRATQMFVPTTKPATAPMQNAKQRTTIRLVPEVQNVPQGQKLPEVKAQSFQQSFSQKSY
jgi:hypothetical protein